MVYSFRRTSIVAAWFGLASFAAFAQEAKPISALSRQAARIDFSLSASGEFSGSNSGTNYLSQSVKLVPSGTVGYLIAVHYTKSPFFGLEFNYNYARYSENFTLGASTVYNDPAAYYGIQANTKEYTGGYVVHAPGTYFNIKPFADAGIGTIQFKPTIYGGEGGFKEQYRMAYHGGLGGESYIYGDHVGLRGEFRAVYHNSPDFLTNYITIHQHTISYEPVFGVFLRF